MAIRPLDNIEDGPRFDIVKDVPACIKCKHYIADGTCEAYPSGIPSEILIGGNKHSTKMPGDNGIQYDREG